MLSRNYAGGPSPREIFELPLVALNTGLLLASSITFGIGMQAMVAGNARSVIRWLIITGILGAAFVGVELHEFSGLIAEGATPQRSGFLSAFFTLVATHGTHVTFGIIWLVTLTFQLKKHGLTAENNRRIMCLSMFCTSSTSSGSASSPSSICLEQCVEHLSPHPRQPWQ